VVLIDGGRVAATGAHAELLAREPRYREVLAAAEARERALAATGNGHGNGNGDGDGDGGSHAEEIGVASGGGRR
jgi:hypothetical protein